MEEVALVSAVASALVAAMTTGAWKQARDRFVQLHARLGSDAAVQVKVELMELLAALRATPNGRDIHIEQDILQLLRLRLFDLLDKHPEASHSLRELLGDLERGQQAGDVSNELSGGTFHGPVIQAGRVEFGARPPGAQAVRRSIVLLEAEGRESTDSQRAELRRGIYSCAASLLRAAGADRDDYEIIDRGDAVMVLVDQSVPPAVLLRATMERLPVEVGKWNSGRAPRLQLRLRVVVDDGEVVDAASGGMDQRRFQAFRLLDHDLLRRMLRNTTAPTVVCISSTVYQTVLQHGFLGISADSFREVSVKVKNATFRAWIHDPDDLLVRTVVDGRLGLRSETVDRGVQAHAPDLLDIGTHPEMAVAARELAGGIERLFQALGPPPEGLLGTFEPVVSDGGGSKR
ncbi:hypothetical protein [Streptomyces sp. MUSC 14]|uniref:hypothetical protein n=1 Tax=Streptomyces sp. MUSC 14 TaxID=1354889 RepID=UPI0011602877|nr:hypothetical protein [Streptomyces sp. MUSC 14]